MYVNIDMKLLCTFKILDYGPVSVLREQGILKPVIPTF